MSENHTPNPNPDRPAAASDRFDPTSTQNVINATGPQASPRTRQVMGSLIQHLHDFVRENELTMEEWMAGVELMNWAGKMSDAKRNETLLVSDILGVESYVVFSVFLSFFLFSYFLISYF